MILIVSSSLNPESKSRILATSALGIAQDLGIQARLIDMREYPLALCDGDQSFSDPNVARLRELFAEASAVLFASPVYNYDLTATLKNLIEHVGGELSDKVVGVMCAGGGERSYMAPLSFLNSLILDFRSIIVPRFVYASPQFFTDDSGIDEGGRQRIEELVRQTNFMATSLSRRAGLLAGRDG